MERRDFIKVVSAGVIGAAVVPFTSNSAIALPARKRSIRLSQLIQASYKDVLSAESSGRPFCSHILNKAVKDGRIILTDLGATVVQPVASLNGIGFKQFEVQQMSTLLVWTHKDEHEKRDVVLVNKATSLLQNGLFHHDSMLEEQLKGAERIVVSKTYKYQLGECHSFMDDRRYSVVIYTAYARIPERS